MTLPGRKILLLDVCHTLYLSNTTFDFLAWYLPKNPAYQAIAKRRRSVLNRVSMRLGFKDTIRNQAIALLSGFSCRELKAAADAFTKTLPPINAVQTQVNEYKSKGYKPILLSSSLDFIVDSVAQRLEIETSHSTLLNYQDSICLGTIKRDLIHTKASLIKQHYNGTESVFITDNRTDLDCMTEVSKFIAVHHKDDAANARYWRRHGVRETLTYG
ncbi:MAG: HAD superfamily phosphoserine phosphatase-like hydrolase [Candidatus Azotimanducaceae bacterium]|jgi:HAD superfamily phosphoserine phosphatase-like hydrolase